MRSSKYKGRCEKVSLSKCEGVCRTYSPIQLTYAKMLEEDDAIASIRCNVALEGLLEGSYTSDFVCIKTDGDLMVRECVYRSLLIKPKTAKLLEESRQYWLKRGVSDWGLVVNEE